MQMSRGLVILCLLFWLQGCASDNHGAREEVTADDAQAIGVSRVRALLQMSPERDLWYRNYFQQDPDGKYLSGSQCRNQRGKATPCYDIIVANAAGREGAERALYDLTQKFPDVAFQLWMTTHKDTYAIVAAIGLPREKAKQIKEKLQCRGLEKAAFWQWPKFDRINDIVWPWK
jgi:hypothetical protein